METTLPPSINGFGSATFTMCDSITLSALIIGGGGGGSSGFASVSGGAGGGGGGIENEGGFGNDRLTLKAKLFLLLKLDSTKGTW